MSSPQTTHNYPCSECSAGIMHLEYITYFTWLSDELISVPNFPAWICDMCGRRDYDQKARVWLTALLNPETGKNNSSKIPVRPVLLKRPHTRPSPD
ncbi:MAG: YgiT-type zinc finger protein [Chloroflexota bacterium]